MKHYHTLTQAHINKAFNDVYHRENYKGLELNHSKRCIIVVELLKARGFNPRQIKNAQ